VCVFRTAYTPFLTCVIRPNYGKVPVEFWAVQDSYKFRRKKKEKRDGRFKCLYRFMQFTSFEFMKAIYGTTMTKMVTWR
jgi:hypothetical protein